MANIEQEEHEYDYINPHFIPFAFHYDNETVVTREADQIQVIKLTGFHHNQLENGIVDLRNEIKKTLSETITTNEFAIYIHTVRTKKNLDDNPVFQNFLNKTIHEAWCIKNYWRDKFVNELYISIVKFRPRQDKITLFNFIKHLFIPRIKNKFKKQLEESVNSLSATSNKILLSLEKYGARKLSITENHKHIFSEIIEFYSRIINVNRKYTAPIAIVDMAQFLAGNKIAFGNNALEVKGFGESFASIFSFKEVPEFTSSLLDKFLQLPQEFIITQISILDNKGESIEYLKKQADILRISEDKKLNKLLNLSAIQPDNNKLNYIRQQLTLMVIAGSQEELNLQTSRMYEELSKLGLMVIREDINLENIFYSQLPGNFSFIRREKTVFNSNLADFASLHNFTAGKDSGKWGAFLTLFRTSIGTPYFFDFFASGKGHTLITGNSKAGKTTMMNFLISESTKYMPNIISIYNNKKSAILYKLMDFNEINWGDKFKLDPFYIESSELDQQYFEVLFFYIIDHAQTNLDIEYVNIENLSDSIKDLSMLVTKLPLEERYISNIVSISSNGFQIINKALTFWYKNNNHIFEDKNYLSLNKDNNYINLEFINEPILFNIILLNLMQQFILTTDKQNPSLFALEKANKAFFNFYNLEYFKLWLEQLHKYNSICILSADNDLIGTDKIITEFFKEFSNKFIFATNLKAEKNKEIFKLDDWTSEYLSKIDLITRQFILNQGDKSVIAELNLTGLHHILGVLAADEKTNQIFDNLEEKQLEKEELIIKFFEEIIRMKDEKEKDFVDYIA